MDLHFDEKILEIISKISHLNIITDKEISIPCINKIKNKIQAITIEASERITIEYLEELKSLGIKISLFAKDNEKWGELAERFFDFSLEKEMAFVKEDIKIDYLHIDGDHSYEGVKKDFELYSTIMSENGIITIHDTDQNYHNTFVVTENAKKDFL